jgi:CubicO group peptidase (beta-lactamase class C family)
LLKVRCAVSNDEYSCPDLQAWKRGPEYSCYRALPGYENGAYRSYWYVADPGRGHISAVGLAGQLIVIDPSSNTIVVKFSSHVSPAMPQYDIEYAGALAVVDALSGHLRSSAKNYAH